MDEVNEHHKHLGIEQLVDTANYPLWKLMVDVYLKEKDLYRYVIGEEVNVKPEDQREVTRFAKLDVKVHRILLTTVSKNIITNVMTAKTGKEMYEMIRSIFEKDSDHQKETLFEEFFSLQYDSGLKLVDNISKLQNISHSLNMLGETVSDVMIMAKILKFLPPTFRNFATAWQSTTKAERTVANMISRLISEESMNTEPGKSDAAFNVNYKRHFKEKFCSFCKKKGHNLEQCFKKQKSKDGDKISCSYCKKPGHEKERCFALKRKNKEKKEQVNEVNHVSFMADGPSSSSSLGIEFVVDSGSTAHLINSKSYLENVVPDMIKFSVAKAGESITSKISGDLVGTACTLRNVHFLPDLRRNLLSVRAITENQGVVTFSGDKVFISKDDEVVLEGNAKNGLYTVCFEPGHAEAHIVENAELWHRKLGHIGKENLKKLSKMCTGMNLIGDVKPCEICLQAKQTRNPFTSKRQRAGRVLELIHSDVSGPIFPSTHDGKRFVVSMIDDFTHFTKVYLLKEKSEVEECFKNYIREVESFFNLPVHKIRIDGGGEYKTTSFLHFCSEKGIVLDVTTPATPQHNSTAERYFRTLFDKARALIFDSGLNKEMWGEAVFTACYLINRSPSAALDKCTPFEKWYNKPPNLKYLQVFGSIVSAKVTGHVRKLDARAKSYVFVGYGPNCYRLWDKDSRKIIRSRDTVFVRFPETQGNMSQLTSMHKSTHCGLSDSDSDCQSEEENNSEDSDEPESVDVSDGPESEEKVSEVESSDDSDPESDSNFDPEPRYPVRDRKKPDRFNRDSVIYDLSSLDLSNVNADRPTEDSSLLTYHEAISGPDRSQWLKAIEKEKESLLSNHTWKLVNANEAKGEKLLNSRWVFRVKDNGVFKARLVARGYNQPENTYSEVFSPVVNNSSLRTLLAVAAHRNMNIFTFDFSNAFLNAPLHEKIFMKIPDGFKNSESSRKICLLKRSLYGLKQAPLRWNETLKEACSKRGMFPLKSDQCIFKNKSNTMYLAVHVDDSCLCGVNPKEMKDFLKSIQNEFKITVDFKPKNFVGYEIANTEKEIRISQKSYVTQMLDRFGMSESNGVDSPLYIDRSNEPVKSEKSDSVKFPVREAVGSLLYLSTKTRPDISFAVNYESRNLVNPDQTDLNNVKRTFRYLKKFPDYSISYKKAKNAHCELTAYADSDYAGCPVTSKSTSGYVIFYNGGPISWSSKKQEIVATSSTEAEFISAAHCCKEFLYLKFLIEELTEKTLNVKFNVDSKSAISMIKTDTFKHRTKHVQVRYCFLHQYFREGLFKLSHVSTHDNVADLFTKDLQKAKLQPLVSKLFQS